MYIYYVYMYMYVLIWSCTYSQVLLILNWISLSVTRLPFMNIGEKHKHQYLYMLT